ncbi:hypothetical protein R9X49_22075 [Pectobacterium carotovorum]|uniref:hypothetical protein n=1 Tax=Pectobacterium TaxID=122277 RepID=UPI0029DBDB5F|nr:hypothetical protein [Pectobacterium carotovorum]MDX6917787.1 hypothetical protein [Pectobacterium carotovorum]
MDEPLNFSLSYEKLTQFAEARIRDCDLDSQGMIYISESTKAAAILRFWYALALNGDGPLNEREARVEADYARLRKLVWPETDKP